MWGLTCASEDVCTLHASVVAVVTCPLLGGVENPWRQSEGHLFLWSQVSGPSDPCHLAVGAPSHLAPIFSRTGAFTCVAAFSSGALCPPARQGPCVSWSSRHLSVTVPVHPAHSACPASELTTNEPEKISSRVEEAGARAGLNVALVLLALLCPPGSAS